MMKVSLLALTSCLLLAACASTPQNAATAANDAACVRQANAAYRASTVNLLARIPQTNQRYGAPTLAFEGERLAAENARSLQIRRCETFGLQNGSPTVDGVPVVTPHIVD